MPNNPNKPGKTRPDPTTIRANRKKRFAKLANPLPFVRELFTVCPVTGERQTIVNVKGSEHGLDHIEIITKGDTTKWKHKIFSINQTPATPPTIPPTS